MLKDLMNQYELLLLTTDSDVKITLLKELKAGVMQFIVKDLISEIDKQEALKIIKLAFISLN